MKEKRHDLENIFTTKKPKIKPAPQTKMKDQLELSFGIFDNDPFIMSITFSNGDLLKITKY